MFTIVGTLVFAKGNSLITQGIPIFFNNQFILNYYKKNNSKNKNYK